MSTQARLPATLPDPRQARSNLLMARELARTRARVVVGMQDYRRAARDEEKAARLAVEAAESDLLNSAEGSREGLAAQAEHGRAWARLCKAEEAQAKVAATLKLARNELADADKQLLAAREDMEAIRRGRRKP